MSRSVEAVSRRCRLTLVSMVSRRVGRVDSVSEGGLTVHTRGACLSVDCVECQSVERVGACRSVSSVSSVSTCQACRVLIKTSRPSSSDRRRWTLSLSLSFLVVLLGWHPTLCQHTHTLSLSPSLCLSLSNDPLSAFR